MRLAAFASLNRLMAVNSAARGRAALPSSVPEHIVAPGLNGCCHRPGIPACASDHLSSITRNAIWAT